MKQDVTYMVKEGEKGNIKVMRTLLSTGSDREFGPIYTIQSSVFGDDGEETLAGVVRVSGEQASFLMSALTSLGVEP